MLQVVVIHTPVGRFESKPLTIEAQERIASEGAKTGRLTFPTVDGSFVITAAVAAQSVVQYINQEE